MEIKFRDMVFVFHRGFAVEVHCPLATWIGQRCERCDSDGTFPNSCPVCYGEGWIGGHGRQIAASQPVESVNTVEQPWQSDPGSGQWFWWNEDDYRNSPPDERGLPTGELPGEVFRMLLGELTYSEGTGRKYPTPAAAQADLSQALIRWGKGERG